MGFLIEDLSYSVPTRSAPILDGLNLRLRTGGFHVLLGPNGAGKTSLLRLMLGFIKPSAGRIFLEGKELASYGRQALARQVAYVPQVTDSDLDFPVQEVLAMARYPFQKHAFAGLSRADQEALDRAIRLTGCAGLLDKNFMRLSGGERQRVLSCRALAQGSAWIFFDEPVANLDLRHSMRLLAELRHLQEREGISMVCVLHDLNLAQRFADEVILLSEGRLVAQGKRAQVLQTEVLSPVYQLPILKVEDKAQGISLLVPEALGES